MSDRKASIKRETRETNISLELNLDGSGSYEMLTGIRMFDHMLSQLARHGIFDLRVSSLGQGHKFSFVIVSHPDSP